MGGRRALLLGAASTALLLCACGKSRVGAPRPLVWYHDVDLAYAEAKRLDRPLFLAFVATWDCVTAELEHETFSDPDVAAVLHEGFVLARVDCSDDEEPYALQMSRRFQITGIATLIVTQARTDHELCRVTHYLSPQELAGLLKAARTS